MEEEETARINEERERERERERTSPLHQTLYGNLNFCNKKLPAYTSANKKMNGYS